MSANIIGLIVLKSLLPESCRQISRVTVELICDQWLFMLIMAGGLLLRGYRSSSLALVVPEFIRAHNIFQLSQCRICPGVPRCL